MNWHTMRRSAVLAGVFLLAVLTVQAQQPVAPGFDTWQTLGAGATFYSFADDPIPRGFFCKKSEAFDKSIALEGIPLVTDPPRALKGTDTIFERLDWAEFDSSGVAVTRLRARALSLRSRDPIETACGSWNVTVGLAGEQPITNMVLTATDATSGTFSADLLLNVRMKFTHILTGRTFTLDRTVFLDRYRDNPYSVVPRSANRQLAKLEGVRLVDADMNGEPELSIRTLAVQGGATIEQPTTIQDEDATLATGQMGCNRQGECLPLVAAHLGILSETHFVVPIAYEDAQLAADPRRGHKAGARAFLLEQLQALKQAGVIDEDPVKVLNDLLEKNR